MRRAAALVAGTLLAGCDTVQSATGADGRHSEIFNSLFVIFLVVTIVVYVAVMLFLAAAILRRRGRRQDGFPDEEGVSRERSLGRGLIVWTAVIALGLSGLTLASFVADRQMARASSQDPLRITLRAHQWWWEVVYEDPTPSNTFRTANELHLPVDVPVLITLQSDDVIHSFWVPNLAGKQDLIPGRTNDIALRPTHVGYYRGQCAEFCGIQHAHMALDVTVEPRSRFDSWRTRQLLPAPMPVTPQQQAGLSFIENRQCGTCHNITGTNASGQVAPDLTHLLSRRTIGAGTYPLTRGHLYGWIADPQSAKPGNNMPNILLEPEELHAVIAYLETLR